MIQKCVLEDDNTVQQIWALQHIAYRLEAELIGFKELPPLMDTVESIRRSGETFYAYVNEYEEIQGVISIEQEEHDTLTIARMMVHPTAFRQGIASQLIEHVFAQYPNVPLYIVSTGKLNQPAVALYEKYGFRPVETFEVAPGVKLTTFHRLNPSLSQVREDSVD
ncbi:GNAT family N-acetyltransferase [Paenibacillus sp. PsM32]|uniref:GNAT family N-acetyltransferase n=1 Tax=unclassified Paenibacillus TaxID=185978 RepID=UPI00263B4744|nr:MULTISPECIES: GNAT family N-acetyltransferase [unclassified Paenibacillus]MDN4620380.1 GNAT family N-acetyltransferase [Paenibacillus sp. PsM32]MDQ1235599.1 ribosomal protein S18 acetylase RimI-like enzyme [Paenibacillus sp. SORGH_AS_0306]MDR6112647.1 ribosomal protein S18 acetylase RimI-like enzyme [Paenibacillus sp. SORGH_AS_0338]